MSEKEFAEQIVREFRKRLEEVLNVPMRIILYGSHARGEATEGSDIDVFVIVPELDPQRDSLIGEVAWEIGFKAEVFLSVVPISEKELPMLKESPFLQNVFKEGIVL